MANGCMTPVRLNKIYSTTDDNCWKCNKETESYFHKWWTCNVQLTLERNQINDVSKKSFTVFVTIYSKLTGTTRKIKYQQEKLAAMRIC